VIEPARESGAFDATIEYVGNYLACLDPSVGSLSIPGTVSALQPLVAKKGLTLEPCRRQPTRTPPPSPKPMPPGTTWSRSPIWSRWRRSGRSADGAITHTALANGNVQAARIFSSDAVIAQDHFGCRQP
jgi:hypothetical protein